MTEVSRPVVVGMGIAAETEAGAGAVELAAWEARRRHTGLHLVYGHEELPPWLQLDTVAEIDRSIRDHGTQVLDRAVADIVAAHPGLGVSGAIHPGGIAAALVAASATASLVIVPADARVHYGGLLAGLVSIQVAMHARAPVIVVPPPAHDPARIPIARVVVGVDSSAGSDDAVAFAFEEAHARDAALRAVCVWDVPGRHGLRPVFGHPRDSGALQNAAEAMLAAATAPWRLKYPDVEVTCEAVRSANPVRALGDAGAGAALIVVGPRGRGGFAALLLGSVSDGLVRYSPTDVAVVHPMP